MTMNVGDIYTDNDCKDYVAIIKKINVDQNLVHYESLNINKNRSFHWFVDYFEFNRTYTFSKKLTEEQIIKNIIE